MVMAENHASRNAPATTAGARAVARCDELGVAPYSDMSGGLFRAYLTRAHAAALDRTAEWMVEAGMNVRVDAMGTLIGRYEGRTPDAPTLLIGSHIDSVRDAGRYDGPLGVMLGIECVAALNAAGRRLDFAIDVLVFGDEEGSRFPSSMLCSQAVAGVLTEEALAIQDSDGVSVLQARDTFTARLNSPMAAGSFASAAYDADQVIGFLEAHIEQGPALDADNLSLSAVSGIAAQARFEINIRGRAGHAGTSAMSLRQDALCAAAEIVLIVEKIAKEALPEQAVVATVGQLDVTPGAVNVVPGHVRMSLDVRAKTNSSRDHTARTILDAVRDAAGLRMIPLSITQTQELSAAPCDVDLTNFVTEALNDIGEPKRILVSGAGHDAMVMSQLCPSAMLFIRCAGGVSHNPAESVEVADVDVAFRAMMAFLDRLERHVRD